MFYKDFALHFLVSRPRPVPLVCVCEGDGPKLRNRTRALLELRVVLFVSVQRFISRAPLCLIEGQGGTHGVMVV